MLLRWNPLSQCYAVLLDGECAWLIDLKKHFCLTHSPIDWLIDCLTDYSINWLVDCLIDRLFDYLIIRSIDWLIDWNYSFWWLFGLLISLLVCVSQNVPQENWLDGSRIKLHHPWWKIYATWRPKASCRTTWRSALCPAVNTPASIRACTFSSRVAGRFSRPVINIAAEAVEWIGSLEQVYLNVCVKAEEAVPGVTTHREISETAFLSEVAAMTPYSDHNQSPRNLYQCQVMIWWEIKRRSVKWTNGMEPMEWNGADGIKWNGVIFWSKFFFG